MYCSWKLADRFFILKMAGICTPAIAQQSAVVFGNLIHKNQKSQIYFSITIFAASDNAKDVHSIFRDGCSNPRALWGISLELSIGLLIKFNRSKIDSLGTIQVQFH